MKETFGDLEEVLDTLRVEAVALATDALHLLDLSGLARRLDVLEVDVWVLTEVDDASQEVEQSYNEIDSFNARADFTLYYFRNGPSKLLKDSKISMSDVVVSCS